MNNDFEIISEHEVTEYINKNLSVDTSLNNIIIPPLIDSKEQTCSDKSCSSDTSSPHKVVESFNEFLKSPTKNQKKTGPTTAESIKDKTNRTTKKKDKQYRHTCFCFK